MKKMNSGEKIALGTAAALALAAAWKNSQKGNRNEDLEKKKEKKIDAKKYEKTPSKFIEIFEDLESEFEERTRHHHRRRHEGYVFNIKVRAYPPSWVENFISDDMAYEIIDLYKEDELRYFIDSIKEEDSSLYQDWFDGHYEITGRSGGYLNLSTKVKGKIDDAMNIIYNHSDEFIKHSHFIGEKLIVSDENVKELESIANDVLDEFEKVDELEKKIEELKRNLEEQLDSDDFWESYILDNEDVTEEEIRKAKS